MAHKKISLYPTVWSFYRYEALSLSQEKAVNWLIGWYVHKDGNKTAKNQEKIRDYFPGGLLERGLFIYLSHIVSR
jgi:hypothetical protein